MKLLYNPISPFARMCLITARELGIDGLEIIRIEGLFPAKPTAEVVKHNPLGRVPTLLTNHGHAIHDSRVICEYFAHHAGDKSLLPDEPVKRFRVLTLQSLGQGMAEVAVAMRYELALRPEGARWSELVEGNRARLFAVCDDLERQWPNELMTTTLGSISVAAALAYIDFRHGDLGWRNGRSKLADWFADFSSRPSMNAA